MALGRSIRNAIGSTWRAILSGVSRGQSAASSISQAIENIPSSILPPVLTDNATMQQIASMAESWQAATDAFGRAAGEATVDAGMITLAPWSMDLNAFNAAPSYHIVLGARIEGREELQYRTVTGITDLPGTVQELRDLADLWAQSMSVGTTPGGGMGGTVLEVPSVTITVGPALG